MQHNTGRQAGNNGCRSDKMFGVNRLGLICRDDAEHTTRTQPPDSATVPIFTSYIRSLRAKPKNTTRNTWPRCCECCIGRFKDKSLCVRQTRMNKPHVVWLMKVGANVRTVITTRQGRLCLSPKALPTIFFTVGVFATGWSSVHLGVFAVEIVKTDED